MSARNPGDRLLQSLLAHVVEDLPGALGAGVSRRDESPPRAVAGVGVATRLDALQWERGEGPLWEAFDGTDVVVAGRADEPEGLRAAFDAVGAAGAVVVPGSADDSPPVLLSVYFAAPPDKDVVEQVDRLEAVVAGAVAVVEHCAGQELRADQMMHMMQYRRVIEQSKGAIMGSLGTDATAAFATLARASQHFNVRLRNLAVALVEHVGHAPAEAPDDPEQVVVPTDRDRTAAAQVWAALAGGPDDPGQAGARGERRG